MTRDGELSYKVVHWDENLLRSAGKTPASLLFNIQCSDDAVSQLHFPHCEKELSPLSEGLSVVHISDGGMDVLHPKEITETHVIVDVPHLSCFGLAWNIRKLWKFGKTINGQILLFQQREDTMQSQKLNVFLLPDNVPLLEVKAYLQSAVSVEGQQAQVVHEYILAPSTCDLIRGQKYSVDCSEADRVQPLSATFDCKYGPNFHPTFEIRLNKSKKGATVIVKDKEKTHVWDYHVELTASASSCTVVSNQPPDNEADTLPAAAGGGEGPRQSGKSVLKRGPEEESLLSVQTEFIDRVSAPVLKYLELVLHTNRVINDREMESNQTKTRTDKAHSLINMVLKKGNKACRILIETFREQDPFLYELLFVNQEQKKTVGQ
uniref:CARD domain-containing protein n=2 Tax=Echeneis naucrates TaxID=173247 RepID=A0A665THR6_ECHNA